MVQRNALARPSHGGLPVLPLEAGHLAAAQRSPLRAAGIGTGVAVQGVSGAAGAVRAWRGIPVNPREFARGRSRLEPRSRSDYPRGVLRVCLRDTQRRSREELD